MISKRCSVCGYTKEDALWHGDHHLCSNRGRAPWELLAAKSAPLAVSLTAKALEMPKLTVELLQDIQTKADALKGVIRGPLFDQQMAEFRAACTPAVISTMIDYINELRDELGLGDEL
jgi:hypothetical protein